MNKMSDYQFRGYIVLLLILGCAVSLGFLYSSVWVGTGSFCAILLAVLLRPSQLK